MNALTEITTFELLKTYRAYHGEIAKRMEPVIARVKEQAQSTGKAAHEVQVIHHEGRQFVCVAYHADFHTHCMAYMIVQGREYSEAFALDTQPHRYHHYHDHFFLRYAQRLHLTHKSHLEVITHYFNHNPLMVYSRYIKRKKNIQTIMAVVRTGVVYGYIDHTYRITNFRTLIDHYTLTRKKKRYAVPLKNVLRKMEGEK